MSDIDLSNMQSVRTIRDQLDRRDGVLFANYVARHHIKSANYCGQPLVRTDGEAPDTVGEAINLTARRDANERQVVVRTLAPNHPGELAKEKWDELIRNRDVVIDAQARLRSEHGNGAKRRPEWNRLEIRMAEIDQKLVAMKPTVFGDGS